MSSYERASLIGNYHALSVKESIDPSIKNRGYTAEQLKNLENKTQVRRVSINSCNLSITGDLKQFNEPNLGYYLEAFYAYDNHGVLPFSGSFSEQPSKMLDIIEILKQMQNEEETRIRKQIERDQKRNT